MNPIRFRPIVWIALLLLAGSGMAQNLQVYRCVDGGGAVTLRDTPCEADETQEMRSVRRPPDPPPSVRSDNIENLPAPSGAAAVPAQVKVVMVAPPQPLYECTTPDGGVYTSDNGDGNPRWVPLWTQGFVVGTVGLPNAELLAGSYIRDHCTRLPQREVCSRLVDRRYEILRRYGTVSPAERRALDREQEVLDERLANDCRGY